MSDRTHSINIKLAARDEASQAFKSATARLKEFALEQRRSGESQLEKLAKGAGVVGLTTFAVETMGAVGKAASDALSEGMSKNLHPQEIFGKFSEEAVKAIPIFGKWAESLNNLGHGVNDAAASIAKLHGATESEVDGLMDAESLTKKYTEAIKEQAKATEDLRKQMTSGGMIGLKGTERSKAEATSQFEAEKSKLVADFQAFSRERGGIFSEMSSADQTTYRQKQQTIIALEKNHQKELNEIDREGALERQKMEADHQAAMTEIFAKGRAAILHQFSTGRAAESQELADRHEKEQNDLIRRRDEAMRGKTPEEQDRIKANARAEMQQLLHSQDLDGVAFEEKIRREREEDEFSSAQKVEQIRAEAAATALRGDKQDAQARLLELQAAHKAELTEIDRQTAEKLRRLENDPNSTLAGSEADRVRKQSEELKAALNSKYGAEVAATNREAKDQALDQKQQTEKAIASLKLDILKQEAASGNTLAEQEAKRLELIEKYAEKRQEINRLEREGKNLTDDQRKQLAGMLSALDKQEGIELLKLQAGLLASTGSALAPGGEAGRGDIGIRAGAEARRQSEIQKLYDPINRQLQAVLKFEQQIPTWTQYLQRIATNTQGNTSPADQLGNY